MAKKGPVKIPRPPSPRPMLGGPPPVRGPEGPRIKPGVPSEREYGKADLPDQFTASLKGLM